MVTLVAYTLVFCRTGGTGLAAELDQMAMISLVVPIYNEAALIDTLHERIVLVLDSLEEPWQVVYVDDGSSDSTLELLLKNRGSDPRVIVVELSRNWGHQSAITAGLAVAEGSAVVLMDGDLQDPPEAIPDLIRAWQEGAQVVVAQRRSRVETGLRRWLFPLFYKVLGFLSDFPIPLGAGIFGLLDRQAVDAINQLTESNRYIPGLRAWVGFRTKVVHYDRGERLAGPPKQTLVKLLKYGLDAIFSFSYKPLRLGLSLGLLTALFALLLGVALFICRMLDIGLFGMPVVAGYSSTIICILLLGGIQLISLGVLGEYIGRIYDEVKRRPLYLIRRTYRSEDRK